MIQNLLKNEGYILTYDWAKNQRATTIEELKVIGQEEKDHPTFGSFLIKIFSPLFCTFVHTCNFFSVFS